MPMHKVLFWSGFGIAVRFWQLGIEMRPFFNKESLWVYPLFATIGGSFGYWLEGVESRQLRILGERKEMLLEKRTRRAEREAKESGGLDTGEDSVDTMTTIYREGTSTATWPSHATVTFRRGYSNCRDMFGIEHPKTRKSFRIYASGQRYGIFQRFENFSTVIGSAGSSNYIRQVTQNLSQPLRHRDVSKINPPLIGIMLDIGNRHSLSAARGYVGSTQPSKLVMEKVLQSD